MSDESPKWFKVYLMLDKMFTPQEAIDWLDAPNIYLDDKAPMECTADEVLRALKLLRNEDKQ